MLVSHSEILILAMRAGGQYHCSIMLLIEQGIFMFFSEINVLLVYHCYQQYHNLWYMGVNQNNHNVPVAIYI